MGAAETFSPKLFIILYRNRDGSFSDNIGNNQPASRFQDPEYLFQGLPLVRAQVDHTVGYNDMRGTVRKRNVLQKPLCKHDIIIPESPDHFLL